MMCVASSALDLVGTGPGNTEITNGDPGQFVKPHSMRKIDTSQIWTARDMLLWKKPDRHVFTRLITGTAVTFVILSSLHVNAMELKIAWERVDLLQQA